MLLPIADHAAGSGRVGGGQQRPITRQQERFSLSQRLDVGVDALDRLDALSRQCCQAEPHRHDDLADHHGLGLEQQVVDLAYTAADHVLDGQCTGRDLAAQHRLHDVREERDGRGHSVRVGGQDGVLGEGAGLAGKGHAEGFGRDVHGR